MNPIKVGVVEHVIGVTGTSLYSVMVEGFGYPLKTASMSRERAEAMKVELENVLGVKALAMIKVVNYGLAGRGFEGEFTVGGKIILAIPESQQAFFRATLVALRDEEQEEKTKTPYEVLLDGD
jgi:hypothetical protein